MTYFLVNILNLLFCYIWKRFLFVNIVLGGEDCVASDFVIGFLLVEGRKILGEEFGREEFRHGWH